MLWVLVVVIRFRAFLVLSVREGGESCPFVGGGQGVVSSVRVVVGPDRPQGDFLVLSVRVRCFGLARPRFFWSCPSVRFSLTLAVRRSFLNLVRPWGLWILSVRGESIGLVRPLSHTLPRSIF